MALQRIRDSWNVWRGKVNLRLDEYDPAVIIAIIEQMELLNDKITTVRNDMTSVKNDVSTLKGEMTTAQSNISQLQTSVGTNTSDISTLKSSMSTAQTDIGTLQGDMTTAKSNISTLQSGLGTAQTDISTLQGSMSTAQTDIGALQGDMTTAKSNISTLQSGLGSAQSDISSLQTNVGTLQSDMTTAKSNISTLQSDMTTAKSNISTLQSGLGTAQTNIGALQSSMNTEVAHVNTSSTTADMAYAKGEQFSIGGLLYKALTNIASGATLTLNSNYELVDPLATQISKAPIALTAAMCNSKATPTVNESYCSKVGRICNLNAVFTITSDIGAGSALITSPPVNMKPIGKINFLLRVGSEWHMAQINAGGQVACNDRIPSGSTVVINVTYASYH